MIARIRAAAASVVIMLALFVFYPILWAIGGSDFARDMLVEDEPGEIGDEHRFHASGDNR